MMIWFCYEKNFANQWIPKIYHDEVPSSAVSGKEVMPERTVSIQVPNKYLGLTFMTVIQHMMLDHPPPETPQ